MLLLFCSFLGMKWVCFLIPQTGEFLTLSLGVKKSYFTMQILWGKGLSLLSSHCCYDWPQCYPLQWDSRQDDGGLHHIPPAFYPAKVKDIPQLFFPHPPASTCRIASCFSLVCWAAEMTPQCWLWRGCFIWSILFREAINVRIIMPFQTDCLSHWSITSTDRTQRKMCVCMCAAHIWDRECDGVNQCNVQICPSSQQT